MSEFLILCIQCLLASVLIVYMIFTIKSIIEDCPSHTVYKILSFIGFNLNVSWYYHIPKGSMYGDKYYLTNIKSKIKPYGYKLIFVFRRAYPMYTSETLRLTGQDLERSSVHYISLSKKGKAFLLQEANKGIEALKELNTRHKYKYRIINGKVV